MINSVKKNNDDIKYLLKGQNGQLYVYEDKIKITRKGFFAVAFQGLKGEKIIPLSSIKSVEIKPAGFFNGYIQFGIGGGIEGRHGLKEANYDENSVTFGSTQYNKVAKEIKKYIENYILNKTIRNNPSDELASASVKLKNFKALLDEGLITQEEYELKKKQILDL